MRLRTLALLLPFAHVIIACGSDNNNTTTDAGTDSSTTTDGGTDGGSGVLPFKPSNVDLTGMDLTKAGDVIITGANCGIADTEGLSWSCVDKFAAKQITLADQSKLTVFVVKSLRIEADALVTVGTGAHPLAIVALDTIVILGKVRLNPGKAGGGYNTVAESKGTGPGGGGSGTAAQKGAGTGGSFCGIGGLGTAETGGTVHPKSTAYGTSELVPLLGGSGGGVGAIGFTGSGGGAIQFTAGKSIELKAGAFISVPGEGGNQGGLAAGQEATGGGSGGGILLEAETVTVAGVLAANGGGGGEGAGGDAGGGKSGENGRDDNQPGKGGAVGTMNHGGDGSAADTADGKDGLYAVGSTASAGGGGAGRIRINTRSGSADITSATLSPSKTTSCFTQGTLKN